MSRWRILHPPVLWLVRLWSYRAFSDLDRKAWWLQQVAWAVKHSPIARTAADQARTVPSSDGAAA